jgi:L-ascorbate metabolism protein UlaG (beta-lactamase superfamily)
MTDQSGVTLTWLGQAGFLLRSAEATVLVDAFLSDLPGRRTPPPVHPSELTDVDVILCSHEHIDHLDGPTVVAVAEASPNARVVVPAPVFDQVVGHGVSADRVFPAVAGEPAVGLAVPMWPIPAQHGVEVTDAYNFGHSRSNGGTRYLGYVVELAGVRIYHAGDTLWWPGLEQTLRDLAVRVMLLPINGRDPVREAANLVGNMDHREAALLADAVGADLLVPMHWEMFAGNRGYPDHLVAIVERLDLDVAVMIPRVGRPFRYLPG